MRTEVDPTVRVLLVEDDRTSRENLAELLRDLDDLADMVVDHIGILAEAAGVSTDGAGVAEAEVASPATS